MWLVSAGLGQWFGKGSNQSVLRNRTKTQSLIKWASSLGKFCSELAAHRDSFLPSPSTVSPFIAFLAEKLGRVILSNKHIRRKVFSSNFTPLSRARSLSRALSHDAPAFANKRGHPIEVTRLKLAVSLVLFAAWKAAHTLTGYLASAVMTEANIQNSTNGCGKRLSEESKTTLKQPFFDSPPPCLNHVKVGSVEGSAWDQ